jgi:proton glutamate symport protein
VNTGGGSDDRGGDTGRSAGVLPILVALVAGAAVGALAGADGQLGGFSILPFCDFVAALFINLLKMIIVPLVVASVITGVSGIGGGRDLGRLGGLSLTFYVTTTLLAVLIAQALVMLVQPGLVGGLPARELLALSADTASVAAGVKANASGNVFDVLLGIVPPNIIEAAAGAKLLGLLFFSVLFGFSLTRIPEPQRGTVTQFFQGLFLVMMRITHFVMRLAPFGVFALTTRVVAKTGFAGAGPLLAFGGCVLGGLVVFGGLVLPLLMRATGTARPWRIFPALAPALLTAFTTASSSATLPLTLECTERRAGVSARVSGFVLPLGVSVNHAGTALYECAAALFIAQAYGLDLSFGTQFVIVLLALVTSAGIAGVPAASLVGIAVILGAVGLPAEAIGVLLVLERPLDMARTAVNVLTDAVCAVIVARLSGERPLAGAVPLPAAQA